MIGMNPSLFEVGCFSRSQKFEEGSSPPFIISKVATSGMHVASFSCTVELMIVEG